tara:strand:+ start:3164 stop:3541 length:378 start_codon:yes stop_codon:yes gene_type:complete
MEDVRKLNLKKQRDHWKETGEWIGIKDWWYYYYVKKSAKNLRRKSDWKLAGLKDDLDLVLQEYLSADKCLICDVGFNQDVFKTRKVMNHCHETGYYLNILCWECNIREHSDKHFIQCDLSDCEKR